MTAPTDTIGDGECQREHEILSYKDSLNTSSFAANNEEEEKNEDTECNKVVNFDEHGIADADCDCDCDGNVDGNGDGNVDGNVDNKYRHRDATATAYTSARMEYTKKKHVLPEFCLRDRICELLDRWPRMVALVKCQLLFFFLLTVTFIGGYVISKLESPGEIETNDDYLRQTWFLKSLPLKQTKNAIYELPAACLFQFVDLIQTQNSSSSNSNSNDTENNNGTTTDFLDGSNNTMTWNNNITSINSYIDQASTGMDYLRMESIFLTNTNVTWKEFHQFANLTFPNIIPQSSISTEIDDKNISSSSSSSSSIKNINNNSSSSILSNELYGYMIACEEIARELLLALVNFTVEVTQHESGSTGLTFDWIRCWNETELGYSSDLFKPTTQNQISASMISNQTEYFTHEWNKNRIQLHQYYVTKFGCDNNTTDFSVGDNDSGNETGITGTTDRAKCYWEATHQSVLNASGGRGCMANTGSSSWFWFTIMTTVGYGNTPPNTFGSRMLVYLFGWLSIVAFGGIMLVNAYTFTTIADDIFVRFNMKWLQRPIYSTPLWGLVNVAYIALVAFEARRFWDTFVPDFACTLGDSYWFSYITLFTIGLGDFYLQPQGIFPFYALLWSFLLLHGFGFMSSFLSKFSELAQSCFPQRAESLAYHLARTDLWGGGINIPISKSLEILKQLVEMDETPEYLDVESSTTIEAFGSDGERRSKHKYGSSFHGNERAKAPDGNTINYHRIRILIEKKNLLIKLLKDNQSEFEDRVNESLMLGLTSSDNRGDGIDPLALHHVSRSLTTLEDIQREEEVLESALLRTKELKAHLEAYMDTN